MTREEILALAKEKLGKDITEQEVQDYLSGKAKLPDEALDLVSGGGDCSQACPKCGNYTLWFKGTTNEVICDHCHYTGPAERRF